MGNLESELHHNDAVVTMTSEKGSWMGCWSQTCGTMTDEWQHQGKWELE